jgi:hypothetical protein
MKPLSPPGRMRVAVNHRNEETPSDGRYKDIGRFLGVLGALTAFFWVYVAAIGATGWAMGIALGWATAWLAAVAAFAILRYLLLFLVVRLIRFLH